MFDENTNAKAMAESGLLQEMKNYARGFLAFRPEFGPRNFSLVVICMFSSTRELSREFMQATIMSGLNTHDFVYILPWLQVWSGVL